MKKKIGALIVCLLILVNCVVPAFAAPMNQEQAVFDLTNHAPQSIEIDLGDGETGVLGIEYVRPPKTRASYDLVDGEWRIYWYNINGTFEYYIDISKGKIVDAYDINYLTIGCECDSAELSFTSTKSTGKFALSAGSWPLIASWNSRLTAEISGTKLKTDYREIN